MLTRWTWAVLVLSPGCQLVFGVDPSGRDASARLDGPSATGDGGGAVDAGPPAACRSSAAYVSHGGAASPRYARKGTASSYDLARDMCAIDGALPVSITERGAEWARLAAQAPGAPTQWFGLQRSSGTTTAVDNDVIVQADLPWAAGEPVAPTGCVVREGVGAGAGLKASACTDVTAEVLCECPEPVTCAPSSSDMTTVGPADTDHAGARAHCAMIGQRLWRPASGPEFVTVRAQHAAQNFLWVEVSDAGMEGSWRAEGGCVPYLRWGMTTSAVPEPDGDSSENCAALFLNGANDDLVDVPCGDAYLRPLCQPL